jgi:hypothetical protein
MSQLAVSSLNCRPVPALAIVYVPPFQAVTGVRLWLVQAVIMEFPTTPSKFHYTFSLRDLSQIWTGILLTTSESLKTTAQFVRVWRNEFTRVVCDRLITEQVRCVIKCNLSLSSTAFIWNTLFHLAHFSTATSVISFGENQL